jgi:hypothetical protein
MKCYKVKKFAHESKKLKVSDKLLSDTLVHFLKTSDDERQRYSLGAGLYKLRLATNEGQGKSGGSRTILAFKTDSRVIWLHLFAKNDKGNVTTHELKKLKSLADILLSLSVDGIARLMKLGELYEVNEHV